MTEIPEHLLARAKQRRSELTGATPEPTAEPAGEAVVPAESAAAPAEVPATAPPAAVEAPPEPATPWVEAALTRKKIPYWVMPVLLFFPLWLFIYVGTLEEPTRDVAGPLAEGAEIYAANCASCHGGSGGGGVGQQLSGGEVLLTFPSWEDQIAWIVNGSPAAGTPYGDPGRPGGQRIAAGGMPAFGDSLSASEILAVTLYERVQHGGQPEEELLAVEALAESADAPPNFETGVVGAEVGQITTDVLGPEFAAEQAAE